MGISYTPKTVELGLKQVQLLTLSRSSVLLRFFFVVLQLGGFFILFLSLSLSLFLSFVFLGDSGVVWFVGDSSRKIMCFEAENQKKTMPPQAPERENMRERITRVKNSRSSYSRCITRFR